MKALYAFPTSRYNVLRLIGTEGLGFQFISLSRSHSIEFCIHYFNCSEFQTHSPLGKGDLFRSGKRFQTQLNLKMHHLPLYIAGQEDTVA